MLRIITGKFKGRKIETPDSARPLTDRIKTSIFDTIQEFIKDSDVLDCFSGSGSFGFEALSRGSNTCAFIESNNMAIEVLEKNIQHLGVKKQSKIIKSSVEKFILNCKSIEQNIIMVDPPFPMPKEKKLFILENILLKLSLESLIIYRIPIEDIEYFEKNSSIKPIFSKKFGISMVNYYRNQK